LTTSAYFTFCVLINTPGMPHLKDIKLKTTEHSSTCWK